MTQKRNAVTRIIKELTTMYTTWFKYHLLFPDLRNTYSWSLVVNGTPYIVKSFFLENQGFFSVSSINIPEEGAIGMDISLYLVRK